MTTTINSERVKQLLGAISDPIAAHLADGSSIEALNAIAMVAALVFAAIANAATDAAQGERELAKVRRWFDDCLDDNIDTLVEASRGPMQ